MTSIAWFEWLAWLAPECDTNRPVNPRGLLNPDYSQAPVDRRVGVFLGS